MRRYLIILFVCMFALATGISTALAGGSSDTSGDGFHCYLFFSFPDGEFSQAMVNDSDPDEVLKKVEEFIAKYVDGEGGTLDSAIGNIDGSVCDSNEDALLICECDLSFVLDGEQCEDDLELAVDGCVIVQISCRDACVEPPGSEELRICQDECSSDVSDCIIEKNDEFSVCLMIVGGDHDDCLSGN